MIIPSVSTVRIVTEEFVCPVLLVACPWPTTHSCYRPFVVSLVLGYEEETLPIGRIQWLVLRRRRQR